MNPPTPANPIGATALFSLLLHAVLLLGVTFHFAQAEPGLPTLDVTLVNVANREAPDKADFLAQANNSGGGQSEHAARPSQMFSGALPRPDPGIATQVVRESTPPAHEATPTRLVTTTGSSDFSVTSDTAQTRADAERTPDAEQLLRQQAVAPRAARRRGHKQARGQTPNKKIN
jgi:protein TonB